MAETKKPTGIHFLAASVILSNFALLVLLDYIPETFREFFIPLLSILSMLAVYPLDFFQLYFGDLWLLPLYWILFMTISAVGVWMLNRYARMVFIVLCILHIIILWSMVFFLYQRSDFLDHVFKLYFHTILTGTYMGFLTIPEIRLQFGVKHEGGSFRDLFRRIRPARPAFQDPISYFNLGVAYLRLERNEEAARVLKQAVKADPENPQYHYHLGCARRKTRNTGPAVDSLKRAIELDPLHRDAYKELAGIYRESGSYQQAAQMYEKILNTDPEAADICADLADVHEKAGHFERASELWERARGGDARNPEIPYRLARISMKQFNDPKAAREWALTALRIDPDRSDTHFLLGEACLKLQRYKDAVHSFQEAVRLDYHNKQAHFQLGFSYVMLKDMDSARRELKYLEDHDEDLARNLKMLLA